MGVPMGVPGCQLISISTVHRYLPALPLQPLAHAGRVGWLLVLLAHSGVRLGVRNGAALSRYGRSRVAYT